MKVEIEAKKLLKSDIFWKGNQIEQESFVEEIEIDKENMFTPQIFPCRFWFPIQNFPVQFGKISVPFFNICFNFQIGYIGIHWVYMKA